MAARNPWIARDKAQINVLTQPRYNIALTLHVRSSSMDIEALVTDLDGTFWATDMSLHAASLETVARLDAAEVPFIIATGRRAQGAMSGIVPLGLQDRAAVLMNGALVRDRLDGPSFHQSAIPNHNALAIRNIFVAHDLEPLVYIDDPAEDLLAAPDASAGESFLGKAPGVRRVDDLVQAIEASTVIGFGAFGYTHEHLSLIQGEIEGRGLASVFISPSHIEGDQGIMVQGANVDKSTGLDALCERHGLDRTKLAVVGDGFNDFAMLRSAALAIVPNNAPPEIQAIADVVIEPNESGGWKVIPDIIGV